MTALFLRSTGQRTGHDATHIWTVMGQRGEFVQVDELLSKESLSMYTADELKQDPSLRYRRINANNLIQVGKLDTSDVGKGL